MAHTNLEASHAFCLVAYYSQSHERLFDTHDAIDTPRVHRSELPPRSLPWSTVIELLRSIDRHDAVDWREYTTCT